MKCKCGSDVKFYKEIDDTACECYAGGYADGSNKAEALNRKIWEGLQDRCKKHNTYYEGYCNIPEPSQTPKCTYETCPIVAKAKEGL